MGHQQRSLRESSQTDGGIELLLLDVEEAINKRVDYLQRLAKSPSVKQHILEREYKFLETITELFNRLAQFRYLPVWEAAESIISELERIDPTLCGHIIKFRTYTDNDHFSLTEL